jgi:hypothetical protein
MPDESRVCMPESALPTATQYPLTLEGVSRLFDEAGLPRNVTTLQRYCAAGRLDCIKEETALGAKWLRTVARGTRHTAPQRRPLIEPLPDKPVSITCVGAGFDEHGAATAADSRDMSDAGRPPNDESQFAV